MPARRAVNDARARVRRKVRLFNLIRLFGGILLIVLLIEAGRSVIGSLVLRPYAAKWGTIEKGFWTQALFLRDETLLKTPAPGKLRKMAPSGGRVPRSELVAEVSPMEGDSLSMNPCFINAPEPGYLFFQYDGWEEKFALGKEPQLSKADFEREYQLQSTGNLVQTGEIIGKVINPFQQWLAIQVVNEEIGLPKVGVTWWIKNQARLAPIFYRQNFSIPDSNQQILLFEERGFTPGTLAKRLSKIYIVYRRVTGICVPKHAVFKDSFDKKAGTWSYYVKVMKGDEPKPQRIRVLETDGSNVIVEGIEFGTVIITR